MVLENEDIMKEPLKEIIIANSNQAKINPEYVNKLHQAGLHNTAGKCAVRSHGFLVLKETKIIEFLKRMAPQVGISIGKLKPKDKILESRYVTHNDVPKISVDCVYWTAGKCNSWICFGHRNLVDFELIWNEVPVDEYEKIIPEFALDKLLDAQSKNLFDFYTVVDLKTKNSSRTGNKIRDDEARRLRDPLILGRKYNNPERYVIAQWGDDILTDDLL